MRLADYALLLAVAAALTLPNLGRPSLWDIDEGVNAEAAREMRERLDQTLAAVEAIRARTETIEHYDQMIGEGNAEGNAVVQAAIDDLTAQTKTIEQVVAALGLQPIKIEGSDSLDDPDKIFK